MMEKDFREVSAVCAVLEQCRAPYAWYTDIVVGLAPTYLYYSRRR